MDEWLAEGRGRGREIGEKEVKYLGTEGNLTFGGEHNAIYV